MNNVNKIVGKKITGHAGLVSLLILAAITSISGVTMTIPDTAYASDPHRQNCVSIAGDGGHAGSAKNRGDGGNGGSGDGGNGGWGGHVKDNVNVNQDKYRHSGDLNIQKNKGGPGGDGGNGIGGKGGDASAIGGDGGDGGKSKLACIIVDPDLTIKPVLVIPPEAFEPRPHR